MQPPRVAALLERQQSVSFLEEGDLNGSLLFQQGGCKSQSSKACSHDCQPLARLAPGGNHGALDEAARKVQGTDLLATHSDALVETPEHIQRRRVRDLIIIQRLQPLSLGPEC